MNTDQLNGILRSLGPAILTYIAGKGWISTSSIPDIMAALLAVSAAIWSVTKNSNLSKINQVSAMSEVKKIVTDNQTANIDLAANNKVTTS